MSLPASDGFSAAVTEGHHYARELYVCDLEGKPLEALSILEETTIEVSSGLVRRSGNLVIPNPAGIYTPASGALIDFGKAYLLRFTVQTLDGDLSCDQPLLFPDSDQFDVLGNVTIPVSDGMRVISAEASLALPLSFPDGTPLEDIVRAVLVACGAPDDDAYYDLDSEGEHVVGDHGYEVGARPQDILETLLKDHSCDLWCAPPVVYKLRPTPDPLTADPVATWEVGRQVRIIALSVKRQSLARNHAIVEGIDRQGRPFVEEVFDLNPASPVMYGAAGVGDLVVRHKSDGIRDRDQARKVGRTMLTRYSVTRTFTATMPSDPSLDRRDVVRILDPERGTDTQVMLDGFTLPSAPGAQTFTVSDGRALE